MKHNLLVLALLLGCCALLESCGVKQEKTIHVTGSLSDRGDSAVSNAIASVTIRLTHTRDTALIGVDTTSLFGTRDTIHALIRTDNATEGSTISGRWYYLPSGQKIAENGAPLLKGTNYSHFDLFDSLPWPQGKYELIVLIDRDVKDSAKFAVANKK